MKMQNQNDINRVGISTQTSADSAATGAGLAPEGDESPAETHLINIPAIDIHPSTTPASSVLMNLRASTTNAGQPRQRIQWSTEMNKSVMRCYYISTKIETDLHVYRAEMKNLFLVEFPQYRHLTEQNIADRRRAIITRKLLSDYELLTLKQEAAQILIQMPEETRQGEAQGGSGNQTQETIPNTLNETYSNSLPSANTNNDPSDNSIRATLEEHFRIALLEYENHDPLERNTLPKLKSFKQVEKLTNILNNQILPQHVTNTITFRKLHLLLYVSAIAITKTIGQKIHDSPQATTARIPRIPNWERRLQNKISRLRADIGRLIAFLTGCRTKKIKKQVRALCALTHFTLPTTVQITDIKDRKVQTLAASAKRLARYKESRERKRQNRSFSTDEKSFYRNVAQPIANETNGEMVSIEEATSFWTQIWDSSGKHRHTASWLTDERTQYENTTAMTSNTVSDEEVAIAIKVVSNWKAPGPDKIHNIWIKKLPIFHGLLALHFSQWLEEPEVMPSFLMQGNTFLLPKSNTPPNPSGYRPITCLSTIYKLFTKIITNRIYRHCKDNNIITEEQKGCARESQGCKEQLIIDTIVVRQALQGKRNLSMAFVDYKKAFDSVPHSYLHEILEIYRIDPKIRRFLKVISEKWCVILHLRGKTSAKVNIRRGILQGDAFSPLWFCLSLNPLSHLLKSVNIGFDIKAETGQQTLSHLLYVDDLKLYANGKEKVHRLLNIVKRFSDDIKMEFGLDKCKIVHLKRGKVQNDDPGYNIDEQNIISNLTDGEFYKYLGLIQLKGICDSSIKLALMEEFKQRLKLILESKLNAGNIFKAINTWTIPTLTFSFGVVKWTDTDLNNIMRTIRTELTKHRYHHPKSAIERVVLPRSEGGRGLIDVIRLHHKQICNLRSYFETKSQTSCFLNTICLADKHHTPLNLRSGTFDAPQNLQAEADLINTWKNKSLHGTHRNFLEQEFIHKPSSNLWLTYGQLFPETEGFILSIQDKVVATKNYRKTILNENMPNDLCRRCQSTSETIDHIMGGCTSLATHDYTARHNQVAKIVHAKLAIDLKLAAYKEPYYKYNPLPVMENSAYKLYWDRSIITDQTIRANRPDIVVFDKTAKKIIIYDVAIPLSHNLQATYSTKIGKYTELAHEMKTMYRAECVSIVPIVISTTGLITKALVLQLEKEKLHTELEKMQKAVILSTCNLVRRFLQAP